MRLSLSLLIIAAWLVVPTARAQTAATRSAASQPAMNRTGVIQRAPRAAHPSRRSSSPHSRSQHATGADQRSAAAGKAGGVLALGATDITGNKELPKVMVIVPWKDSMGAGGVVKPTDSLMDEVLQPVDRAVFQRRIRYYSQLDAAGEPQAASRVAPVGDSH